MAILGGKPSERFEVPFEFNVAWGILTRSAVPATAVAEIRLTKAAADSRAMRLGRPEKSKDLEWPRCSRSPILAATRQRMEPDTASNNDSDKIVGCRMFPKTTLW